MKIDKVKAKVAEYVPIVRGFTNWTNRSIKATGNLVVKGGGTVIPVMGKVVAVAGLPFIVLEIVFLLKELPNLKGRAKVIQILAAFGKGDDIVFGLSVIKDWIADAISKGSSLSTALTTASAVMNVTAVALAAISAVVEGIGLYSLSQQKHKYLQRREDGDGQAIEYLTKDRATMKGKRRLFNVLNTKQSAKLTEIFQKELAIEKKEAIFSKIEKRFSHLKKMKAIGIAIAILTIVGVLLLTFLPTPLAPIAWTAIGLSGIFAVSRMIHYLVERHRFNRFLRSQLA